jgi:quinol monooxygenase YgiN
MSEVQLSGRLICGTQDPADVAARYLPAHIESTRAEPGCLEFAVTATEDPLVWDVEERFADHYAYMSHQHRVAASEWGKWTAGITRDYSIADLAARAMTPSGDGTLDE